MPQETSDTHLRNALQALSQIETQMSSSTQPNHVRALGHLRKASEHLNVALKIK
jgi:hypothetical protein